MNKYIQSYMVDSYCMKYTGQRCPICQLDVDDLVGHITTHAAEAMLSSLYLSCGAHPGAVGFCCYECRLCGKHDEQIMNHLLHYHPAESSNAVVGAFGVLTYPAPVINNSIAQITQTEALEKLEKVCNGTDTYSNEAITVLKAAGWTIDKSPAINADGRKGFVLTVLEPPKKESPNVSESCSESNRK